MPEPDRYEGRMDVRECVGGHVTEGLSDGQFKLAVLRAGWTVDRKRFYTPDCVRAAAEAGVFGQSKMFCDHAGPSDVARGTRSANDWWATTGDTWYDEDTQSACAIATAHRDEALAILRSDVARAAIEFSHDSYVEYHRETLEGSKTMVVDRIVSCNSVDFVPFGNAGGHVTESLEVEDEMTADEIKEAVAAGVREGLGEDMLSKLDGMLAGIGALRDVIAGWGGYVSPEYREEESATSEAAESADAVSEDKPADASVDEPTPEDAPTPEEPDHAEESAAVAAVTAERDALAVKVAVGEALDAVDGITATERKRVIESLDLNGVSAEAISEKVRERVDAVREESRAILREHGVKTHVTGAGPSAPAHPTEAKTAREAADELLRRAGVPEGVISAIPKN